MTGTSRSRDRFAHTVFNSIIAHQSFCPAASAEGPKDFETRPAGALPATSNAVVLQGF